MHSTALAQSRQYPPIAADLLPLLQRGWHLFAVKNDPKLKKKIPIFSGSEKITNGKRWGCSNDLDYLINMFSHRRARHAWIGMAAFESNTFILDIDTEAGHGPGHNGHASLAKLIAKYGPLPATLTAVSPSGGEHFFYNYPMDGRKVVTRDMMDAEGNWIEGIDVMGWGGYVVAVPSRGRTWRNELTPIADGTPWLLDLVCERPEHAAKSKIVRAQRQSIGKHDRWTWVDPVSEPQVLEDIQPELLVMLVEDASVGLSLDPHDYSHLIERRLRRLEYALAVIPNNYRNYNEWIKMGASIYNYVGDAGWPLFKRWSRKNLIAGNPPYSLYDPNFTRFKWYQKNGVNGFPALEPGSKVFFHAKQHDPKWEEKWIAELKKELWEGLGL